MANLQGKKDSILQPNKTRGDTPWKIHELTTTPKKTTTVMLTPVLRIMNVKNLIPIWVVTWESM